MTGHKTNAVSFDAAELAATAEVRSLADSQSVVAVSSAAVSVPVAGDS